MKRGFVAVLLAVLFPVPGTLWAATILVPGDFANIKDALAAASDGDTILVGPGTYVGAIDFTGKDVDLRSTVGPVTTRIQSDGGAPPCTSVPGDG